MPIFTMRARRTPLSRTRVPAVARRIAVAAAILAAIVMSPLLAGPAAAQDRPQTAALEATLAGWLLKDCGLSDAAAWRARLRADAAFHTPRLIEALREGPPAPLRTDIERRARQEWESRRQLLDSGGATFLSADDRKAIQQESADAYASRVKADFAAGYRQRALGGLGAIGSDEAIRVLEETARSGEPALRDAARDALAQARAYRARSR
jgi:hypothetical protein